MGFWDTDVGRFITGGVGLNSGTDGWSQAGRAVGGAVGFGTGALGIGAVDAMGGAKNAQNLINQGVNSATNAISGGPGSVIAQPTPYGGAQAPSYLTPNGMNSQASAAQASLLQQLTNEAQGKGPSIAQQQLQQATDQNLRQQAGLAAGGRNPGLASYQAMQNQGAGAQQMAGQSAMARLAEQYQAQQGLAGLANQMQGSQLANSAMQQGGNEFYNQMQANQAQQYQKYQYDSSLMQTANNQQTKNAIVGGLFGGAGSGLQMLAGM